MPKRVIAAFLILLTFILSLSSCSIDGIENIEGTTVVATNFTEPRTTKPEAYVGNIPEYKFKNYVDAVDSENTYTFNVKCSKAEYDEYFQLLLQCGYTLDANKTETQYSAKNPSGFTVNLTFSGTELLVTFVKK